MSDTNTPVQVGELYRNGKLSIPWLLEDWGSKFAELATLRAELAEAEKETGRWQEAIYTKVCKDCPGVNIDGAGSDSGDPLDFTLAEIGQALNHWLDKCAKAEKQRDEALRNLESLREVVGNMHDALLTCEYYCGNCSANDKWTFDESQVQNAIAEYAKLTWK
jgi:hypothetical protein